MDRGARTREPDGTWLRSYPSKRKETFIKLRQRLDGTGAERDMMHGEKGGPSDELRPTGIPLCHRWTGASEDRKDGRPGAAWWPFDRHRRRRCHA